MALLQMETTLAVLGDGGRYHARSPAISKVNLRIVNDS